MIDFEKNIDSLARVPVFGPYLSWLAAAHLTFADALNLPQFRAALYERAPEPTEPVAVASAESAEVPEALREAA